MIELKSVYKKYKIKGFFSKDEIYALKNIDITIENGKHIGIIGESGAGKTTLGKILSLIEMPTSGLVLFDNKSVTKDNVREFRKKIGAVFQDPSTSLDPRFTAMATLKEAKPDVNSIYEMCERVNIKKELLTKHPHQLSGGEQQRIAIARALLPNPEYLLLDEATSALDMSTQAKIINLLCDINRDKRYTYIFISHDLKLANFISDKIYVLYGGEVIEVYDKANDKPLHPYTVSLLKDAKTIEKENSEGCFFYNVCKERKNICKTGKPSFKQINSHHKLKCFLYD